MAFNRSKLSKREDARLGICVGIFGILVCVGAFVFGVVCAIGIINSNKGSLITRIICGIGFFAFFGGGGGIYGIIALIDELKENIVKLKEEKEEYINISKSDIR